MQYPIYHPNQIVQYDEHVFVWMDETGNAGGVATYLEAAQLGQDQYARYMAAGPDWVSNVPDGEEYQQFPPIEGDDREGAAAVYALLGAIFMVGVLSGAWLF